MLLDLELAKTRMQLYGRQMLRLIDQEFTVSEATGALFSFRGRNGTCMDGDDIRAFLSQCEYLLFNTHASARLSDRMLLDVLCTQIKNHPYMKQYITQVWGMMGETDEQKAHENLRKRLVNILNHKKKQRRHEETLNALKP